MCIIKGLLSSVLMIAFYKSISNKIILNIVIIHHSYKVTQGAISNTT